ncbi:hypothetical protein [Pedobacter sp. Hv1]|uniref:hypothetical protein n=1 Tax=Pedobacter sp. Hv1 TaxID=1740090 RepID=UPI000A9A101E|nr:hypothetical protein [Pedobacter sp. Hv1]
MKPNHLFTSLLAVTALFVASCSAPRMVQNNSIQDDVYNSTARAKEYIAMAPIQNSQTDSVNTGYYATSDPYYDMDYSSRIDRFYYGSPWRSYFNNNYFDYGYNGYNNYYGNFYGSNYFGFGLGLGGYFGGFYNNWSNPYYNWAFYGSPYFSNFWGPYSYYSGFYGGGFYGGGFYGGGFGGGGYLVRERNNNPRPSRGSENGVSRANGSYMGGVPTRADNGNSNATRSGRAEVYNPTSGRPTRGGESGNAPGRPNSTDSRPTRTNDAPASSRPTRTNDSPPSRPTYTPPPASSSGGGSRGESGGGGGGGGGRPTRGGR